MLRWPQRDVESDSSLERTSEQQTATHQLNSEQWTVQCNVHTQSLNLGTDSEWMRQHNGVPSLQPIPCLMADRTVGFYRQSLQALGSLSAVDHYSATRSIREANTECASPVYNYTYSINLCILVCVNSTLISQRPPSPRAVQGKFVLAQAMVQTLFNYQWTIRCPRNNGNN